MAKRSGSFWIRNWDIDRQSVYRYKDPMHLPKGTVLHMRYTYDNSTANIHNPTSSACARACRQPVGGRNGASLAAGAPSQHPAQLRPIRACLLEEAWMRNRLRKSPNDRVSLYNLAAALAGEGKYTEAVAVFEQELKLDASDARSLTALGAALDGAGDWQEAQQRYRSAIESAASDNSAACDARFDLASSELRHQQPEATADFRAQVASCPADAATLLGLAQGELADNQFESAVGHLKQSLRIDPASVEAHEQLARAYALSNDLAAALSELRKAALLKPDDANIHSGLSQVLTATDSLKEAIAEQRLALKLDAGDADGWNNLGVLLARTGQLPAAREAFEHALRLDPGHAEAKANLARLRTQN